MTSGARSLYDVRDGRLLSDASSGSGHCAPPFGADLEGFRSGWAKASSGRAVEGVMLQLNTAVQAGHADRWVQKHFKIDQVLRSPRCLCHCLCVIALACFSPIANNPMLSTLYRAPWLIPVA